MSCRWGQSKGWLEAKRSFSPTFHPFTCHTRAVRYFLSVLSSLLLASCVPTTSSQADSSLQQPAFTLWFDAANRVHRTTLQNEASLQPTWVIVQDGDVVLEQSAVGKTIYTYFKDEPGLYTLHLEAWTGERFEVASNVVSYKLE